MKRLDTTYIAAMADRIRDMLGDDYDDETFFDTLDGETDAADIADYLLRKRAESLALAEAAKAQADALAARAKRIKERAQAYDKGLLDLLGATGMKKMERPAATVSIRAGSVSTKITDPDAIPTQLCRIKREPDKTAIKAQIEAGEAVPGAELERGPDTISVRVA